MNRKKIVCFNFGSVVWFQTGDIPVSHWCFFGFS